MNRVKRSEKTSQHSNRSFGQRIQARVWGMVNVPMRVVLGLPFATPLSGQLMVLHLTGRKTGRAYQQPVSYVRQGNTLLTPAVGNWKWNLREDQLVRIRLS